MDILNILKKEMTNIPECDLDYYTQVVETGDYDDKYVDDCLSLIETIRMLKHATIISLEDKGKLSDIGLDPKDIVPVFSTPEKPLTPEQQFFNDLLFIRKKADAEKSFEELITQSPLFTDKFIDDNFSQFIPSEIIVILRVHQLPETTLEKYFVSLDKATLSRYQLFSEDFFMKHFDDLSVSTVLRKGPNPWRKKENRSSKLDVFLKLKGVI